MLPSDVLRPVSLSDTHLYKGTVKSLHTWLSNSDKPCLILSGARGTGKSLIATILSQHLRVFKCDQTDNRSASELRQALRCFSQSSMTAAKESIIICDDIHMLSDAEQTTLNQLIEEFSTKLKLICTCTCTSLIIPELLHRGTIVNVKRPTLTFLKKFVRKAAHKRIMISAKQTARLCQLTGMSFTRLLSALDKLTILGSPLCDSDIDDACCAIDLVDCGRFMRYCERGELREGLKCLQSLLERGISPEDVLASMSQYLNSARSGELIQAETSHVKAMNFHAECGCATTALYFFALTLYRKPPVAKISSPLP